MKHTFRYMILLGGFACPLLVTAVTATPSLSAAADYALSWYSFNGGGNLGGTSSVYGLTQTVGQTVSGHGGSPEYLLDVGFLAGTEVCNCPNQGDINEDGFVDALDLGSIIDILFLGAPDLMDANCPTTRVDFNCDGFSDVTDMGNYIDYMFIGGVPPCVPCTDF